MDPCDVGVGCIGGGGSHIGYCMDDFKFWWFSAPFSTSAMLSAFAFSRFTVSNRHLAELSAYLSRSGTTAFSLSCCRLHGQPPQLGPNHGAAGHLGGFLWLGRQL